MIKLRVCFAICMYLGGLNLSIADSANNPKVRQSMRKMAKSIEGMLPLIYNQANWTQKQAKFMEQNLQLLSQNFSTAREHMGDENLRAKMVGGLTQEFLDDVQASLKTKHWQYAKKQARLLPSFCVACHMQDQKQKLGALALTSKQFDSLFAFAEYKHMLRHYDEASEAYLAYFLDKKAQDYDFFKQRSLLRLMEIQVAIFDHPDRAYDFFRNIKRTGLHKILQNDLDDITKALEQYKSKKSFRFLELTDENIVKSVEKFVNSIPETDGYLKNADEWVYYSILVNNLFSYINGPGAHENLPVALYWLALSEQKFNRDSFYSLSTSYFKECMLTNPKHAYAKKCYGAYREDLIFSYTGSSGSHLPAQALKELEDFQKLIFPATIPAAP